MIYKLLIELIIILWISFIISKKEILSPSVIFTFSFGFCSFWACLYSEEWNLDLMSKHTYWVILLGVIYFCVISFIVQFIFVAKYGNRYKNEEVEIKEIYVNTTIKILCLVFCIITLFLRLNFIIKVTQGSWMNISKAMANYDYMSKFTDVFIVVPKYVGISLLLLNAMCYWFMYILVNNFIASRSLDKTILSIEIVCIITKLSNGGRGGAVNLILSIIAMIYILLKKKGAFKKSIKLKLRTKLIIIAIPLVFLYSFPKLAVIMGRNIKGDAMYYLAIYCGAEIKNLDIFIKEKDTTIASDSNKRNCQTFNNLINWIGPKFGFLEHNYKLDLPFRRVNGYNLGNVYTTFYPYIYDFGYQGIVPCIGLMASILQFVYEHCRRARLKNKLSIWILVYCYMFSSIVLSFFSNKFYEQNFNISFLYSIILWNIFNLTFCNRSKKNANMPEINSL